MPKKPQTSAFISVIQGLMVAVVAIPQVLAYATLAGLPPHVGLYALMGGVVAAALVGRSRLLQTGPVAIVSLLTASALSQFEGIGVREYVMLAGSLAVMVGVMQLMLGLFRLGSLVNFVAHPVILGFSNAVAVIIVVSQLPRLLGVHMAVGASFVGFVGRLAVQLLDGQVFTTALGVVALIVMVGLRRLNPKIPGVFVVVIMGIVAKTVLGIGGPVVGDVPTGMPQLQLPPVTPAMVSRLWFAALVIALVGYMEGITVLKALSRKVKLVVDVNREMLAQGVANVVVGLVGGYPVAGSVSRTMLSHEVGGNSKWVQVSVGVIVAVFLVLFGSLMAYLPYTVLAAVIMVAVTKLADFGRLREVMRTHPRDGLVALLTMFSAFYFAPHIDYAIVVGMIAAVLAHVHRSAYPEIEVFFCDDKKYLNSHHYHLRSYPTNKKVMGVTINASLNFANISGIMSKITKGIQTHSPKPSYVLLFARGVNRVDSSAEDALLALHDELEAEGVMLLISGVKPSLMKRLKETRIYDALGKSHVFLRANEALKVVARS